MTHWEKMKVVELRKVARNMGVDPKKLRKADLIHKMRVLYWKAVR